jgi:thiol-disulfide isomerase/thioredoxin
MLSCNNQEIPATITGQLTNIQDTIITIEVYPDHFTRIEPSDYKTEFTIEKDGTFSIPVNMPYPGSVSLISNDYQFIAHVILLQGGEILLTADCANLKETLKYNGNNDGLNAFNFLWQKFYDPAHRELRQQAKSFLYFKNGLDSLQAISLEMLEDFHKTEKLNKEELLWLRSKIQYGKYVSLNRQAYRLKAQPGDSSYQFFETLNLEDHEAVLISPTYVNVMLDYILYETNVRGMYYSKFKDNSEYFETYYRIIHERLTGKVHDVMLTIFISNLLKHYEEGAAEFYERYLVECKSPDLIKKTSAIYDDYLEIKNQSLSEKVILVPTDGESPMEVLSRFENKVLLLDFWASWCAPCIKGIPHTKELAEHYKDSDLAVIYIGNADQESNLINAIKKHQMDGKHIILNEEETEIWRKEFSIRGIPTYVLLDQQGRVINLDNPHKLSEDSYTVIDSLLTTEF